MLDAKEEDQEVSLAINAHLVIRKARYVGTKRKKKATGCHRGSD